MKFNLKIFFSLFIVSIFFIHLNLPFVSFYCVVGLFFLFLSLFVISIFKRNDFLFFLKKIILKKNQPLILYCFFVVYVITITIILSIQGIVNPISSLLEIFYRYILCMFLCYTTIAYLTYKHISLKTLIKIFYGILYLFLALGVVDFIAYSLNIKPLTFLLEQTHNIETVVWGKEYHKAYAMGLPRVQSVYVEPGFFAENIFLFLPILYSFSLSKYKIFKNNYLNKLTKITTIPLIWFNLILTLSPIWLVGCIVSTLLYFIKPIFSFIKKYFIITTTSLIIISLSLAIIYRLNENQIRNSYLGRIIVVINNIKSIDNIILAEQSLGTRLSNVLNQIDIGMRSPIIGHGHSNKTILMVEQIKYNKSPVAITGEMIQYILHTEKVQFHSPPFVDIFVRYGLVGIFLYYGFILRTIFLLKKYKNCLNGIAFDFASGLGASLLSYIVLTFYDIASGELQSCMMLGICIAIIYKLSFLLRIDVCDYFKNKGSNNVSNS
ncbi:MAG: hypothetical protein E7Z92_05180 [Cyanobacteria bacterium SIG31]|nr:hypothetical protein [Cyanobacteria bacterium SIG31]